MDCKTERSVCASRSWMILFFCLSACWSFSLSPSHTSAWQGLLVLSWFCNICVCAGHHPAESHSHRRWPVIPSASSLLNPFLMNKISLSLRKLEQLLFYCQTGFHLLESIRSLFKLAVLNNSSGKRLSQRPAAAAQTDTKKGPVFAWKENVSVLVLPLKLQS